MANKKAAFITIHGMGRTEPDYNAQVVADIRKRIGSSFDLVHVGSIYYQSLLQQNEDRVWNSVSKRTRWHDLRKFLLFGFGDAAGLESGKEFLHSCYEKAQICIARELYRARREMDGNGPIAILAQSLGCQILSNYFWDAGIAVAGGTPTVGIWKRIGSYAEEITGGPPLNRDDIEFLSGKTLRFLITTGCNIPIFVSAHALEQILPMRPNSSFVWNNFYDKDDALGWPLADLSSQYGAIVTDHAINAAQGFKNWLIKSWNPMAHTEYWSDDDVLDQLEADIQQLMQTQNIHATAEVE